MKVVIPVCPCPWCRATPSFVMWLDDQTWTPKLICNNRNCWVQPESQYVPIRKQQIFRADVIKRKIEQMIDNWNKTNPIAAYEGMEFDFDKIAEDEKIKRSSLPK